MDLKVICNKRISKRGSLIFLHFLLIWALAIIVASCLWFSYYFGHLEFEQIYYHLQFGIHGQFDTDPVLLKNYLFRCIITTFVVSIIIVFLLTRFKKVTYLKWIPFTSLAIIGTIIYTLETIHLGDYIKFNNKRDFIADNYVQPMQVTLYKKPLNLIVLYVESLEYTYTDTALFGEDLLAKINSLPGDTFSKYMQIRGCGWTMAGIVASMCGVPIKPKIIGNNHNQIGTRLKKFLPGVTCLSDILAKHGYTNVYMGGAELLFAGKAKFFYDHNYHQVIGKNDFMRMGLKDFHHWGLYDDLLFEQVKIKLTELRAAKAPFNLTILTLDMHQPGGYISRYCTSKGVKDYFGIVRCTSELVYEFVDYLQQNNFLDDTLLVIAGDHVLMSPREFDSRIISSPKRGVYNKFISPVLLEKNREEIVHFDLFPTILYALGFNFEGNKLGLGISAYGELNEEIDPDRIETIQNNILKFSNKYASFWVDNQR